MQTLLSAVGLQRSAPARRGESEEVAPAAQQLPGLHYPVDLNSVAAATQPGIAVLEQEARTLEAASLHEGLATLRRWTQALRRRPRTDEPLASFRAQFLRGGALETSLEALRRNRVLRGLLLTADSLAASAAWQQAPGPSVAWGAEASAEGAAAPMVRAFPPSPLASPADELQQELAAALQLCFPRGASPVVGPLLRAALGDVPPACAAVAVATVRELKEDWTEVVYGQVIRSLERELDSLEYGLQKTAASRSAAPTGAPLATVDTRVGSTGTRQVSSEHVLVLASLCETIGASCLHTEGRVVQVSSALTVLGAEVEGWNAASRGGSDAATSGAVCRGPADGPEEAQFDVVAPERVGVATEDGGSSPSRTSRAVCEAAVAAMASKTVDGVRRGLQLLGLPSAPLCFVPARELRLCGHDIRDEVNEMMSHWVEDDLEGFYQKLDQIRAAVGEAAAAGGGADGEDVGVATDESIGQPEPEKTVSPQHVGGRSNSGAADLAAAAAAAERPALLSRRAALLTEQRALRARLQELGTELQELDLKLGDSSATVEDGGNDGSQRSAPLPMPSAPPPPPPPTAFSVVALSITTQLGPVLGSITSECQRGIERLKVQVQQRQSQLLLALAAHADAELEVATRLTNSVPPGGGPAGSWPSRPSRRTASLGSPVDADAAAAAAALPTAWRRLRDLCRRVEEAVAPDAGSRSRLSARRRWRLLPEVLANGARCRARWVDGSLYDAEIQSVLGDGSVLVNWLRPRAGGGEVSPAGQDGASPFGGGTPVGPTSPLGSAALRTVSECGGDDSCNRIVLREDVFLVGKGSLRDPIAVRETLDFLEARPAEDRICVDCGAGSTNWACLSFGTYLCDGCAEEHRRWGLRLSLVLPLADAGWGWGWTEEDLQPLRLGGGNEAFRRAMEDYPMLGSMPRQERYTTRFAESYRRRLDALCAGLPPPPLPAVEAATAQASGDFISLREALELARQSVRRLEAAAGEASKSAPRQFADSRPSRKMLWSLSEEAA